MDKEKVERIQELLDAGYSRNKVATILGEHHQKINRIIEREGLEIYNDPLEFLYEIKDEEFSWLDYEDVLSDLFYKAFDEKVFLCEKYINIPLHELSNYVLEVYGNIYLYSEKYNYNHLLSEILYRCSKCRGYLSIDKFYGSNYHPFGIYRECPDCSRRSSKEKYANNKDYFLEYYQYRRTKIMGADYSEGAFQSTIDKFEGRCVLTGSECDLSVDHVIPISKGGGTVEGNLICIRRDLNSSKNNKNIFDWFFENKTRFSLCEDKFNKVIKYLSEVNNMSVDEYKKYTYSFERSVG